MSKIYEALQEQDIERIEGEEQFINEPKFVRGIDWAKYGVQFVSGNDEGTDNALSALDYSPHNPANTNPLE